MIIIIFDLYVNDIFNSSSIVSFIMFADDTNVLFSHKKLPDLIATLNSELSHISSWFKCNKLSKTNYVHFQRTHSNPEFQYNVKIGDLSLDKKDSAKFLGITIDNSLSWNQHLSSMSSQIAKGITP